MVCQIAVRRVYFDKSNIGCLVFQLIAYSQLSTASSKILRYCCGPGCKSWKGRHLFPTFEEECDKWRVAIRRCDSVLQRTRFVFISYGRATRDRPNIERSALLTKADEMFEKGDSIIVNECFLEQPSQKFWCGTHAVLFKTLLSSFSIGFQYFSFY